MQQPATNASAGLHSSRFHWLMVGFAAALLATTRWGIAPLHVWLAGALLGVPLAIHCWLEWNSRAAWFRSGYIFFFVMYPMLFLADEPIAARGVRFLLAAQLGLMAALVCSVLIMLFHSRLERLAKVEEKTSDSNQTPQPSQLHG
jgi:hypothetical protein